MERYTTWCFVDSIFRDKVIFVCTNHVIVANGHCWKHEGHILIKIHLCRGWVTEVFDHARDEEI